MTDERLTELNDRYWHMNPNPKKVPFAEGVTPEFEICRSCSAFVWDQEVHDKFHDDQITRHATFAIQREDGSTFIQFIDGTQVTIEPARDKEPFLSSEIFRDFMNGVNDDIKPGWKERHDE